MNYANSLVRKIAFQLHDININDLTVCEKKICDLLIESGIGKYLKKENEIVFSIDC